MTLRNANKRAKKRKRLEFLMQGHKTIESFIAAKLSLALAKEYRRQIKQRIDKFWFGPNEPAGIIQGNIVNLKAF